MIVSIEKRIEQMLRFLALVWAFRLDTKKEKKHGFEVVKGVGLVKFFVISCQSKRDILKVVA